MLVGTNDFGVTDDQPVTFDVDEVTYGKGGRWGIMERRPGQQPGADRSRTAIICGRRTGLTRTRPPSRRGARSSSPDDWTTATAARTGSRSCCKDPANAWSTMSKSFPSGGANRLSNPGFASGLNRLDDSREIIAPALENERGLWVAAPAYICERPGAVTPPCNRIFTPISPALTEQLDCHAARQGSLARGWPEFMLRTRGSYLEAVGRMAAAQRTSAPLARATAAL